MSYKAKLLAVLSLSLALSSGRWRTLKIGAPQPMTGPDAPFGDKFQKAYSMAVEELMRRAALTVAISKSLSRTIRRRTRSRLLWPRN